MIARSGECRLTVFCEKWRFCNRRPVILSEIRRARSARRMQSKAPYDAGSTQMRTGILTASILNPIFGSDREGQRLQPCRRARDHNPPSAAEGHVCPHFFP